MVHLLNSTTEQVSIEAQTVAEHLDVGYFYVNLSFVWVCQVNWTLTSVIAQTSRDLGSTPQVNVNSLKESLPAVSQQQCPVETLGVLQTHLFPSRVSMFSKRHAPALRVAATKGVDVHKEHGVNAAVSHLADLH